MYDERQTVRVLPRFAATVSITANIALFLAASVVGTIQSPSSHSFCIDSTSGSFFSHFFMSFASCAFERNARRSAQREVAAQVLKFLAVNPSPLLARMY